MRGARHCRIRLRDGTAWFIKLGRRLLGSTRQLQLFPGAAQAIKLQLNAPRVISPTDFLDRTTMLPAPATARFSPRDPAHKSVLATWRPWLSLRIAG